VVRFVYQLPRRAVAGWEISYGGGINSKNTIVGWYEINNNNPVSGYKATYK
jgi:hypothetical protein